MTDVKKISYNTILLILIIFIVILFFYWNYTSNAQEAETFGFKDAVDGVQSQLKNQMMTELKIPENENQLQQKIGLDATNNNNNTNKTNKLPPHITVTEPSRPTHKYIYREADYNRQRTPDGLYQLSPYNDYRALPLSGSDKVYYDSKNTVKMYNDSVVQLDKDGVVNGAYTAHDRTVLPTVTLYYAMWCGYSRAFLNEWLKFENLAKQQLPNIKVASVRCEGDTENMCIAKDVNGYPTIMLSMMDGKDIKYEGERRAEDIVEFVKKYVSN
jgi:thiol-disulfide isomerase/thioredoxin